jgi:ATP-binding cassette, subfamily B, bacterial
MLNLAFKAQPACFTGLVLLEGVQSVVPLASAWLTKLLIDRLAQSLTGSVGSGLSSDLLLLLVGQAVLAIFGQSITSFSSYLNAELGRQLSFRVQVLIYRKISTLAGLGAIEDSRFHDTIQLGAQGAQRGPDSALSILTNMLRSFGTLASFLGALIAFGPLLAGLVVLATLPQLYAEVKMGRQRFNLAYENNPRQRRTAYFGLLLSGVHYAKELRLLNLGNYFLDAFRRLSLELHYSQRQQQRYELKWHFNLSLLSNLVSSGAFIIVVLQAFAGCLSLGDVTLYTSAVMGVQGALSGMVFSLANIDEGVLFFTRYIDLMALPQPIYIEPSPKPLAPLISGIELCNVSFRYSKDLTWILKDVNLTIPAGKCLALVGSNGAGKTTLVKLLTRLYDPSEGRITWDHIDLREFDPSDLRRRTGVIFQDFVRYDLTAFENIALGDVAKLGNGDRRTAEEAVRRAAARAGIHERIDALPGGYQTVLSRWLAEEKQGVDLSGGEWQKIALARLFIRDADLLILDEPTAALDAQAEYEVYNHFVELVAGKTSLLISHRFSTVRMADLIAVLDGGRITEYGSHEELIALGGTYARLYSMQAERYL